MFIYRYILLWLVLIFIGWDIAGSIYFKLFIVEHFWIVMTVLSLQLLAIFIVAYTTLISPINRLKKEIALFLTGGKKGSQLALISRNPEMRFIIGFFNKSLEILKNFKEELQSGKVLRSEVELAAEIQKHILSKTHVSLSSMDIVANSKSASEVGGDSYDIIQRGDNHFVYLGDVTGHGVASGFVMMIVNALISAFSKVLVSGAEILADTNEILKPRVVSNMLMTLLLVRWNEKERKMYMTGAGHEYLIVYKKNQKKAFKVKSGGIALGMTKNISKVVKEMQIDIEPGDVIVLYTDGITEARHSAAQNSTMFGIDRLVETVEATPLKTAQGVFNHITIELSKFMGYNHRQFDDITLIVMHYKWDEIIEQNVSSEISAEFITEWNWNYRQGV